jgi:hypothetical protein
MQATYLPCTRKSIGPKCLIGSLHEIARLDVFTARRENLISNRKLSIEIRNISHHPWEADQAVGRDEQAAAQGQERYLYSLIDGLEHGDFAAPVETVVAFFRDGSMLSKETRETFLSNLYIIKSEEAREIFAACFRTLTTDEASQLVAGHRQVFGKNSATALAAVLRLP